MRINKAVGSKDRLVEIFQRVNHVKLNENLMEMGGANLNQDNVLNMAFDQLKNKKISVDHSNTQVNGSETFVEIACTDQRGDTITFTFKVVSNEGDQEGVYNVNNVTLNAFSFDSADGEETIEMVDAGLKNFNQQHANELYDVIEDYLDVEPEDAEVEQYSDELQEAVALIDGIKKNSIIKEDLNNLLHTPGTAGAGPLYPQAAELGVTNQYILRDALKEAGIELLNIEPSARPDTFWLIFNANGKKYKGLINKNYGNASKVVNGVKKRLDADGMIPIQEFEKPIAGLALGGVVENLDDEENHGYSSGSDYQGFDRIQRLRGGKRELPADDNLPAGRVSPEKRDKILQAYETLIARNSGKNPNYSPTTSEIMAELTAMSSSGKPQNKRTISNSGENYWTGINEEKKEEKKEDNFSPFKQLGTTFKPKSQSKYPKKKKKPQTSVKISEGTEAERYEDIVFMQGDEAYEPLERLENSGPDAALAYLKQWHYPGEHQLTDTLGHGTSDQTYEKDGYIMSWNSRIGYIGLKYDTKAGGGLNEEEHYDDSRDAYVSSDGAVEPNGPAYDSDEEQISHQPMDNETAPEAEVLPGGKADGMSGEEFDPEQLAKGLKVEMEHTDDPKVALEIAMDHLAEIPDYYDHLEGMEQEAGIEGDKESTDMLLGYKPHNVGGEIEGDSEEVQVIDASADSEMGSPVEFNKMSKENKLGEQEDVFGKLGDMFRPGKPQPDFFGDKEQVINVVPITTARDKQGFRHYRSKDDMNVVYAEKDGVLYDTDRMGKPTTSYRMDKTKVNGLVDDSKINPKSLDIEKQGLSDIIKQIGVNESKTTGKTLITEELVKKAKQAINNRGIVEGMTKKEAIEILIKNNIK